MTFSIDASANTTSAIVKVLEKLKNGSKNTSALVSLSRSKLEKEVESILQPEELDILYQYLQKEHNEDVMTESRILSRANPQLAQIIKLGIKQSPHQSGYDALFGGRAGKFVKPGTVASNFSPARYLTELYREAKGLHKSDDNRSLDNRRPDLQSLVLSQNHLDEELSTLSLANELLLNKIQQSETQFSETTPGAKTKTERNFNSDAILEPLAGDRRSGATPFHLPYQRIRHSILLQDQEFAAFRRNPAVTSQMKDALRLGLKANISPELYKMLAEKIPVGDIDEVNKLIKKNFGDNFNPEVFFKSKAALANYYGLSPDELSALLGLITFKNTAISNTESAYKNDQFVALLEKEQGGLHAIVIKRTGVQNASSFKLAELIPVEENQYAFNFRMSDRNKDEYIYIKAGIVKPGEIFFGDALTGEVKKAVANNDPVTLNLKIIESKVQLGVVRQLPDGSYTSAKVGFAIDSYPVGEFLLRLDKLIRLYKATGISPPDISTIIESCNSTLTVDDAVLAKLFWVNHYMGRYGIDASAALVLSGAHISQIEQGGKYSTFTQLFNTPPLNGREFSADGINDITSRPGAITDTFRAGVLKRALQVNDTELYTLWNLVQNIPAFNATESTTFTNDIKNLSSLYRAKLLADVHHLSVNELAMLLRVSPFMRAARPLDELVLFLDQYTLWLKEKNWSVGEIYLMTTTDYSAAMSPDIENLRTTLRDGLVGSGEDKKDGVDGPSADQMDLRRFDSMYPTAEISKSRSKQIADDQLLAASPLIAAAVKLDSEHIALAILHWLNNIKPDKLDVGRFLELIKKKSLSSAETQNLVKFCQVLGQLVLIVRSLQLTPEEIRLWATIGPNSQTSSLQSPTITDVRGMARFHYWLQQCGSSATKVLSALNDKNLTPRQLAEVMRLDELMLEQALAKFSENADTKIFSSWEMVDGALQWLDLAQTLAITPDDLGRLIAVKYADAGANSLYSEWVAVSHALQAGLDSRRTVQLHAVLDEVISTAASAWVIQNKTFSSNWVADRNCLYSYLLIDNQVSAQIKTTRLAEAITSIQLYINRALNGQEGELDYAVRSHPFFTHWDRYNKRYSNWAGRAQLTYYPENYLDPTVRLGQTGMMDEMLQSLSQSQLNSDTVENAFKTYLTRFEEIANLEVISGYHDGVSDQDGTTYLLGCSAVGDYYWRTVDIAQRVGKILPANAWSEWKKITTAVSAVGQLIRPVIFQSRLYMIWVESKEVAEEISENNQQVAKKSTAYDLKYTHVLHDGTWRSPFTLALNKNHFSPESMEAIKYIGMYCAWDVKENKLKVVLYKKPKSIGEFESVFEASISTNGKINTNNTTPAEYLSEQINKKDSLESKLNARYIEPESKLPNSEPIASFGWGDGNYTIMTGGLLKDISASISGKNVHLSIEAIAKVIHNGYAGAQSRVNMDLIKLAGGEIGDVFYVPENKTEVFNHKNSLSYVDCVVSDNKIIFKTAKQASALKFLIVMEGEDVSLSDFYWEKGHSFRATFRNDKKIWEHSLSTISRQSFTENKVRRIIVACRNHDGIHFIGFEKSRVLNTRIEASKVNCAITAGGLSGISKISEGKLLDKADLNNSQVSFDIKSTIPLSAFTNNTLNVSVAFDANAPEGDSRSLGKQTITFKLTWIIEGKVPKITLGHNGDAQYIEYGTASAGHRFRVNTLFANQLIAKANQGIDSILSWETQQIAEPALNDDGKLGVMDFNGANALYFWEMFYYVPMMVFQRLLQESRFDEAAQWLRYVWSPQGYQRNGQATEHQWNVRPLEEETSWHADPLASIDPDAVAQADPMHYKVATFMGMLDLLIARGDSAYRLLERDALNEAKMWYVQALDLLGEEPPSPQSTGWPNPRLDDAAHKIRQQGAVAQAMLEVRAGTAHQGEPAGSLFLPQQNEKLQGYWQTLKQRLYNLRHNLSIDGQPLSLAVYARPSDPAALLSAAVNASQGGDTLPTAVMPLYRFPVILEKARGMVGQLSQFGQTLLSFSERQDAEALSDMLQTQGSELVRQSIALQEKNISEFVEKQASLEANQTGAQSRLDSYTTRYDEDVSSGEEGAMKMYASSSALASYASALHTAAAVADVVPNIYGTAVGGSRYGAPFRAAALVWQIGADVIRISADKTSQSEAYRRRREEWEIQRNSAAAEIKQIAAELRALAVQREAAVLQKAYLETQQSQTQAQLIFLQNKFSNKALYNWLRGKLASIYNQFYDLTISRCLMAQEAYRWELGNAAANFIRPGIWLGRYGGLLAGETLTLNLAQIEQSWLEKDKRAKEVTRTVSLAKFYESLQDGDQGNRCTLAEKITDLLRNGNSSKALGKGENDLTLTSEVLKATVKLSELKIKEDYPDVLGLQNTTRRIKQVSVTLPALLGPYQDVRALLSYSGGQQSRLAKGCEALAVSHGMNDSGQFQLDFNDARYLPFEGIDIGDEGVFTLSFPQARLEQKALLESLSDIIFHIRYTII